MKQITKQNIFNESDFGINLSPFFLIPNILSQYLITEGYSINVIGEKNVLTLKYKASPFSLLDLKGVPLSEDYDGGIGRQILTDNPKLSYSYDSGYNIYRLILNKELQKPLYYEYKVEGVVGKHIGIFIGWLVRNVDNFIEEEKYILNELVSNIILNANLVRYYYSIDGNNLDIFHKGVKERSISIMGIEQVDQFTFKQKRGTFLTIEDIESLAYWLNQQYGGNFVEVTLFWWKGLSMYGIDLNDIEQRYNVRIHLK